MENQFDASHVLGHLVSLGAIFGTMAGYVPAIAAVVAITWYLLQIWESPLVQRWRPKPTPMERERKLALLVASAKVINAEIVALQLVQEAKVTAVELVTSAAIAAQNLKENQLTKSTPEG